MNTRLFNLSATGRKRHHAAHVSYHDRAPIEEDFDTVRYREERLGSQRQILTTGREYLRNDDSWTTSESWLPEDSTAFGLEEESAWFDDDEDGVCIDIQPPLPAPSGQKKRSIISVSDMLSLSTRISYLDIESTPCSVDAEVPGRLPG